MSIFSCIFAPSFKNNTNMVQRIFKCFEFYIDLDEYRHLSFNNINDANNFRYKHKIPCKYQKRRIKIKYEIS